MCFRSGPIQAKFRTRLPSGSEYATHRQPGRTASTALGTVEKINDRSAIPVARIASG